MKTEVLGVDDIEKAVSFLKKGELVAFPTETVYGLGAPLFSPETIQKIFAVKRRPQDNPLIAHVARIEQVLEIACEIPSAFFRLAETFFPGPLTIVLKKQNAVPAIVSAGGETIAFRMPSHPIARMLIEELKEPIVAPSANLSGKPSSTKLGHVLSDFDGQIAAVIDGGECPIGLESTVIALHQKTPLLLRPGSITKEALEEALQQKIELPSGTFEKPLSPGMKYRHYAPKAPLRLVYNRQEMLSQLDTSKKQHFLIPEAKTLYASLRQADNNGVDEILCLCEEKTVQDTALMDRLKKASA